VKNTEELFYCFRLRSTLYIKESCW